MTLSHSDRLAPAAVLSSKHLPDGTLDNNPRDRFGHLRHPGYRRRDFELCLDCNPNGKPKKLPDPKCPKCGGYGEYPKAAK